MPPRTIVAVSNEYGAGGGAVGKAVAELLGFELVDEQLPVVVARRLQISERDAEAAEDTRRTVGERVLASLERATPELAMPSLGAGFDERYLAEVRRAVLEYAARGRVVILGRGSAAILGRRPDVLRVFLHAPRPWRLERIVEVHGVDEETAGAEIDRIDAARRAHLHDVFRLDFGDPHNYDLCLDVAQLGLEGSAALIDAAVRA
ncbi:MAG TPA: cytidylate kinase-like family protein [Candidatus Tyrphobacter sp.]